MPRIDPSPRICSFPPVGNKKGRVVILGSMPGEKSLATNQYYAHPQNQFWRIMGELFGANRDLPYEKRLTILAQSGVIMWESLQSCVRVGSLDSAIEEEVPNDFESFLKEYPCVTHLFFNGAKAEHSFKKHVLPAMGDHGLILTKLPSTSPAHAGMTLAKKLEHWRAVAHALNT